MSELLAAIKQKLAEMKKIENTGFSDPAKAAEYFKDKEILLEEMAKTLETVTSNQSTQIAALEGTIKSLRGELKNQAANPRELSRRELLFNLGKGIAAAWGGNHKALADLSFSPNLKADNWTNPRDVSWGEKGWKVEKATLGDPMGNMATNEQYLINPIYETEIMQDAAKKSVMMNLVRHRPMMGPSIFLPTRDRGGVELHWLTAYGQQIKGSKPKGAERVELKAYTLAGYIPWYDEFEEDVFVDLGAMFIDEFIEVYGQEFDRQCLVADDDPFTGAMAADGAVKVVIAGASINDLTWKDFRDAVYKIPAEERKDCCWFLNETVRLSEPITKQITGNDRMTARFLYGEYFNFVPSCKIFLATNHKPVIKGTDHGIWRRIKLIPFTTRILDEKQDKRLDEKLKAEASGILNWLLEGTFRWRKERLRVPAAILHATDEYRGEMDVIGNFLKEWNVPQFANIVKQLSLNNNH